MSMVNLRSANTFSLAIK